MRDVSVLKMLNRSTKLQELSSDANTREKGEEYVRWVIEKKVNSRPIWDAVQVLCDPSNRPCIESAPCA